MILLCEHVSGAEGRDELVALRARYRREESRSESERNELPSFTHLLEPARFVAESGGMDRDGSGGAVSAKNGAPVEANFDVVRRVGIENDGVMRRDRLGVLAPGGGSNVEPSARHAMESSRNLKARRDVKDRPNSGF